MTDDAPTEPLPEIEAEKTSEINNATTDLANTEKATENMEVHHHPDLHHKPKKMERIFFGIFNNLFSSHNGIYC